VKTVAVSLVTAAITSAAGIFAYDRVIVRPALQIGIVDLAEIYRAKEAEFAQMLAASASEEERQRALALARQFAQRLPEALDELPRECRCLVILRSALAGATPNGIDLTAVLKKKVQT
jgi:hypothetical protein